MTSRPGSAQPQAPSPAANAHNHNHSHPNANANANALAALRGGPGGGGPSKNFGPPTLALQSDTVVFQAAKIPLSSARHAAAPGAAARGPSARAGGAYSSAREMDARRGSAYGGPAPPGYDRAPPDMASHHSGHVRGASEMGPPQQQQQRRPRSPPPPASRDRADMARGYPGANDATPSRGGMAPVDQPHDSKEFMHLMEDATSAPRARAAPTDPAGGQSAAKRQARPSSADSKASNGPRGSGVIRLTVRVMKDGDKLGFGIRNDSNRKLKVSTLQTNSTAAKSTLKIGDTILSVNGIDLTDMGFLEVIQQLKATKPGELVFDIERSLDEDESLSGAEGSHQGETMDLDSPLSVAEKRFGPSATRSSPGAGHTQQQLPPSRHSEPSDMTHTAHRGMATQPELLAQQRGPPARERMSISAPGAPLMGRDRLPPQYVQGPDNYAAAGAPEPPRKRPRPAAMTPAQVDMELARMDKQHRAVLSALTLELKKERTEKLSLEEKNAALRKRLQNMLIECDEVRVKANSTVASIKEHAQRDIHELKQALQAARAQLRLQDRGPDVGRTDSIVNDLLTTKEQLNRLRKVELERATNLSNRYGLESRQAEREASRTRDKLIDMFTTQLREVARRNYNNNGVRTGKDGANANVVVQMEGLRRLAFVKMFGLSCSYEWYTSDDFYSTALVRHSLPKQDDVMDIFGNTLCHEERAGLFLVATAPMNVAYDPTTEKLTLSCAWVEQNQVRELARNFRF